MVNAQPIIERVHVYLWRLTDRLERTGSPTFPLRPLILSAPPLPLDKEFFCALVLHVGGTRLKGPPPNFCTHLCPFDDPNPTSPAFLPLCQQQYVDTDFGREVGQDQVPWSTRPAEGEFPPIEQPKPPNPSITITDKNLYAM